MSAGNPFVSFRLTAANRDALRNEAARRQLTAGDLIRLALVDAGVPLQLQATNGQSRNTSGA